MSSTIAFMSKTPSKPPVPPYVRGLPKLAKWRKHRDRMSQEELAAKIGVTQSMISHWENGESDIPLSTVHDIATALDTTIERLLRDPGDGEDFYRIWAQLPESERPRALRILRNLTD